MTWTQATVATELDRRRSAKERVLDALIEAGPDGLLNTDLNAICYRYGARIKELRDEGHAISEAARVSAGVYRYTYTAPVTAGRLF